jgi:hypothetical protein
MATGSGSEIDASALLDAELEHLPADERDGLMRRFRLLRAAAGHCTTERNNAVLALLADSFCRLDQGAALAALVCSC